MEGAAAAVAAELTEPRWQARTPVFAAIALPKAAAMLSEVAALHAKEAAAKRALLDGLAALLLAAAAGQVDGAVGGVGGGDAGSSSGGGGISGGGGGREQPRGHDALRDRLTAAVAAWLSRPFADGERCELLLGALAGDMAGF